MILTKNQHTNIQKRGELMYIKNMKLGESSSNLTEDEIRAIVACIHMASREGMYEFTELDGIDSDAVLSSAMEKLGVEQEDIETILSGY